MPIIFTFILLCLSQICFAQYELNDDQGIPQIPEHGIDLKLFRLNKLHGMEVYRYSGADTILNTHPEKVFELKLDAGYKPIFLNGCLHEGNDPCKIELHHKLHYLPNCKINASVSTHYEGGRYLYDSTKYSYNDSNGYLSSSDRYTFAINSAEKDTLRGNRFYRYEKGYLSEKEIFGYKSVVFPKVDYERTPKGLITKYKYYDDQDALREVEECIYDDSDLPMGRKTLEDGAVTEGYRYFRDKNQRIIEKQYFDKDTITKFIKYKYDKSGHVYDEYEEPQHEQWGYVTKYKYDKQGNLTELKRSTAPGVLIYRYTYTYDASGKLLLEVFTDADGSVAAIYKYKYYK